MKLTITKFSLFVLIGLLFGCSAGKRSFEKGDYDRAVLQAVKRLRQNPNSKKAQEYLPIAYRYASEFHNNEVNRLKSTPNSMFKYDNIVTHYRQLNTLFREISRCPACKGLLPELPHYQDELSKARFNAAKYAYQLGLEIMQNNPDMFKAREAFRLFDKVKGYKPDFQQVDNYLTQALELGTLHVLIEDIPVHSRRLAISNDFFMNQVTEYVNGLNYTFVQFHRSNFVNRDFNPDQVVDLYFDDFVVGQTYVKEKVENLSKDSVVTGSITGEDGVKRKVYGTVFAEMHTMRKSVTSSGLLNLSVIDVQSNANILQRKLPGTFIWEWQWGFYNGDERALNAQQLELTKRKPLQPPPPQDLFVEFTKPIYSQVVTVLRNQYLSHR
jgi:hypothetical protein